MVVGRNLKNQIHTINLFSTGDHNLAKDWIETSPTVNPLLSLMILQTGEKILLAIAVVFRCIVLILEGSRGGEATHCMAPMCEMKRSVM
jgi:hypothetical protein